MHWELSWEKWEGEDSEKVAALFFIPKISRAEGNWFIERLQVHGDAARSVHSGPAVNQCQIGT